MFDVLWLNIAYIDFLFDYMLRSLKINSGSLIERGAYFQFGLKRVLNRAYSTQKDIFTVLYQWSIT